MTQELLKTPLHALHVEAGAKMVPFAGYDMPVQYKLGVKKEHLHTRDSAGLFDVSHMGQLRLHGAGAAAFLESLLPVDIIDLPSGNQRYAFFTNEQGGIMDDLMVANLGNQLFVVVNAACKEQDISHLQAHLPQDVELEVIETDPGLKGDTAQGGTKPAKLSTGAIVRVPLFIDIGEILKIDTRTGEYVSRA